MGRWDTFSLWSTVPRRRGLKMEGKKRILCLTPRAQCDVLQGGVVSHEDYPLLLSTDKTHKWIHSTRRGVQRPFIPRKSIVMCGGGGALPSVSFWCSEARCLGSGCGLWRCMLGRTATTTTWAFWWSKRLFLRLVAQNMMSVNWLQLMNAERKTRWKRPKRSAATQGHLMLNLNDSQKVERGRMSVDVWQWNTANMKTESCTLIQTGAHERRRELWFCCSVEPEASGV